MPLPRPTALSPRPAAAAILAVAAGLLASITAPSTHASQPGQAHPRVQSALLVAVAYLDRAIRELGAEPSTPTTRSPAPPRPRLLARDLQRLRARLARIPIHVPDPGRDFEDCGGADLAFLDNAPGRASAIYLCAAALGTRLDEDIAQVLIHESAHLIVGSDECAATGLELQAVDLGGGRPFANGYCEQCGFDARALRKRGKR